MSRTYRIPDLVARCPRKTHPINDNLVTLEEEHSQWVDSVPLFGERECAGCKSGQIPLFASCCYPTADSEALHAVVAHMNALIFLDHANDMASTEEAEKNATLFLSAFDDPSAGLASPHKFVKLISSLASRTTAVISEAHRVDCRQANTAFARATAQEALDRQTTEVDNVKLTFNTYIPTRRKSVAAPVFLVYARAINGLKISPELLDDTTVKALELAVIDIFIISNDILSYKKELKGEGVVHNLLTILMQDPSTACLDLQHAIDYAANLFNQTLDRFTEYRSKLARDDPQLQAYADAMVDLFVGVIEWQLASTRYNVFESDEDRFNGIMRL
ncbi:isoprenoid synthase domain-containing protein [Pisolithus orientalis]|uniref:isoprenoid synthase domain-containing protein n=1 Tax=Pisolithus orientalis TaxID=936130 RepID=UPI002223F10D|nr:isoprenoid synthase domain-containing protein [Pisolithus orientalis]KAI5994098.1 isoprenoid synthase domain-containing protein [Pisolithus orientalis]